MSNANTEAVAALGPPSESGAIPWMAAALGESVRDDSPSAFPDWYREFQSRCWRDFLETPEPHRKDEKWRFANLKRARFEGLVPAGLHNVTGNREQVVADIIARSAESEKPAGRFVFLNNELVHQENINLPEGVVALPMQEALQSHGDLLRQHFMRDEARLGGKKFAALHGAAELSGLFLYVPRGVRIEAPLEVFHWGSGQSTVTFPHTLIVTEELASATVVDYFHSTSEDDVTMAIGVSDLVVGDASEVQYIAVQEWNAKSRHFQLNSTRVGRDGNASRCVVNLGASWARDESVSQLLAPGGNSDMLAVNLATGDEEYDLRTLQLHEAQHTTSDLLYKNALYDQARTVFSGLIMVGEKAHHTDAFQTCRNLLGSDTAEANAMPGLEINADQVKCSHGSTTGQISEEEIFYLMARGIDPETARRMITFGFLNEVVSKISREGLRDRLIEKLRRKFDSLV